MFSFHYTLMFSVYAIRRRSSSGKPLPSLYRMDAHLLWYAAPTDGSLKIRFESQNTLTTTATNKREGRGQLFGVIYQ